MSTARTSKILPVLVSTAVEAVEAVGVKNVYQVDSVGRGTFFLPAMFASVSKSSLQSLRTKHVVTFFGWLERCKCVVIRAVCVWVFKDELDEDMAHSRSCAQCPFRPQARNSVFAFSSLSRCQRSSKGKKMENRKFVLALGFAFSFLLSEGKVSLYIGLHQLCANFWVKIVVPRVGKKCNFIQFSCLENRHHPEQHMKNTCRFPRRHRCPELLLGRHFQGQPGRCVLDKHLLVRTCCHNVHQLRPAL